MQILLIYEHDDLGSQIEDFSDVNKALARYNDVIKLDQVTSAVIYETKTLALYTMSKPMQYDNHKIIYRIIG